MNGTLAFVPLPGLPELLFILLVLVGSCLIIGRWVYLDAKSHGSDWAWQWGVGVVILFLLGLVPGLVGLATYLLVREHRLEPDERDIHSPVQ